MRVLPLTFLLLGGCGLFGGTLDRKKSCEYDVYDWWGGLSNYVDEGKADGDRIEFDLDPPEGWVVRAAGKYDTVSGDFSYKKTYVQRSYVASWEAEGYGTVYGDGDVDLLTEVSWVDVLGETFGYQEREQRSGCEGTLTTIDGSSAVQSDYIIRSEFRVDSHAVLDTEGGGLWDQKSSVYSGGNSTQSVEYDYVTGTYSSSRETEAFGNWAEDFAQLGPDYDYEGTREGGIDGSLSETYEIRDHDNGNVLGLWSSTQKYDGSGTGTWSDYSSDSECELSFDVGGRCTYRCDDGSSGGC